MEIQGYKYNSESDAQSAVDSLNAHYGIPVSVDAVTQNWTMFEYDETLNFWYVPSDDSFNIVLGSPTTITITDISM